MKELNPYILVAEDDEEDRMLLQDALEEVKLNHKVNFVDNGQDLIDELRRLSLTNHSLPDLIILDLNMPKKDGREALTEIKNNASLKSIPIIILSTSNDKEDILNSYNLGGNSFITKPNTYTSLLNIAHEIKKYWLEIVKLPNHVQFNPN